MSWAGAVGSLKGFGKDYWRLLNVKQGYNMVRGGYKMGSAYGADKWGSYAEGAAGAGRGFAKWLRGSSLPEFGTRAGTLLGGGMMLGRIGNRDRRR